MNEIKAFLKEVFELEIKTIELGNKKECFDEYNEHAKRLKAYLADDEISFGCPVLRRLKPNSFYDRERDYNLRDIFKISHYNHAEHGEFWLAYTSNTNPKNPEIVLSMFNAIAIAKVDNELKIISLFFWDYDTDYWRYGGGKFEDIDNLGKPVAIERLLEPKQDEFGLREYLADK